MLNPKQSYDLAGQTIGCAMKVHPELSHGFSENIYKNSLALELNQQNIEVEIEKKIKVHYKNVIAGNFAADLLISNELIVELKAVTNLLPAHEAQLVNYLTATGIQEGLPINFGTPSLQYKKKSKTTNPSPQNHRDSKSNQPKKILKNSVNSV